MTKLLGICAVAEDGTFGKEGKIPWHSSEDFKRFKELTTGHYLIMGRNTFDSIGKPLPTRISLVLTSSEDFIQKWKDNPQVLCFSSEEEIIEYLETQKVPVAWVIGGPSVFELFFDKIRLFYVSSIKGNWAGDVKFTWFLNFPRKFILKDKICYLKSIEFLSDICSLYIYDTE